MSIDAAQELGTATTGGTTTTRTTVTVPTTGPDIMSHPDAAPDAPTTDGRHLRRKRNRAAVVDALLQLYRDGVLEPSTDQIAARAGVSARSLFRYFHDVDDLARTAIARQYEHVAPILNREIHPELSFDERVRAYVEHRLDLCRAMTGVGLVARSRESFQPLIADELSRSRAFVRSRTARTFAAELDRLGAEGLDADALLDAVDLVCSFEAFHLAEVRGIEHDRLRRSWTATVTRLLAPR